MIRIKRITIGLRMMKTLASTAILTLAYSLLGRNPCFACIGAVFGMGHVFQAGLKNGGNRFVGTLIGGLIAIPFYPLYNEQMFGIPGWIYLTVGLAVLLVIGQMLGAEGGIQPGAVVFYVVLLTVPETRYVSYTINRMIDTGIGVALSLLINRLFPSPREEKPLQKIFKKPEPSQKTEP